MFAKSKAKKMCRMATLVLAIAMVLTGVFGVGLTASASEMPAQSVHGAGAIDTSTLIWCHETVELNPGVNFTAQMNGKITKVLIYAKAGEQGDHIVRIWNKDDHSCVAGPYTWNVTAAQTDGWIEYTLPTPFTALKGGNYVVSVSTGPNMDYPAYEGFFAVSRTYSAFSVDINSGCFGVGNSAYPQNPGVNGRAFLRDFVFIPEGTYNPDAAEGNGTDEYSIHGSVSMDEVTFASESIPLMTGTKFAVKKAGSITKVKAYTDSSASGDVTVAIWDVAANTMISGPHTWTLGSKVVGWQTYTLPSAVSVEADKEYVVAVSTYGNSNTYALKEGHFAQGSDNGTFVTYANGGVFGVDLSALPTNASARSFLRDVVFVPDAAPAPTPSTAPSASPTTQPTVPPTGDHGGMFLMAIAVCLAVGLCGFVAFRRGSVKKNVVSLIIASLVCSIILSISSGTVPLLASNNVAKGEAVSVHGAISSEDVFWAEESVVLNPGIKFAVKVPGKITQVKVYTSAEESGIHKVAIWDAETRKVIAGPFDWNITAGTEGWKSYTLPAACALEAEHLYVASVSNNNEFRKFPLKGKYFAEPDQKSIFVLTSASGVFGVGDSSFPTQTYDARTYFRDVVFVPDVAYAPSGSTGPAYTEPAGSKTIHGSLEDENILFAGNQGAPLNMGMRFATKKSGTIQSVKVYTAMDEKSGTRIVNIYDGYTGEIVSGPHEWQIAGSIQGWQYFVLPEALKIEAYHDYIVAVSTNSKKAAFSTIESYCEEDKLNGDMFILYPESGLLAEGQETFPTVHYENRTYLRDVVFIPDDAVPAAPKQDAALADKESVWLSDLKMGQGFAYGRPVMFDMAGLYDEIYLTGTTYKKGITLYAAPFDGGSFAEYNIENLGMKTFAAEVGVSEEINLDTSGGSVQFVVYVDGKEVARTQTLTYGEMAQLKADITGGKILRLVLENGGDDNFGDLGVWANAALSKHEDWTEIYKSLDVESSVLPTPTEPAETTKPSQNVKPSATPAQQAEDEGGPSMGLWIGIAVAVLVVFGAVTFIFVKKKLKG